MLYILLAHLTLGDYTLAILAAIMQLIGWGALLNAAFRKRIPLIEHIRPTVGVLLLFVAVAGSAKFLLQTGSLHPGLAKLAFGFRPIVIGYLHLVLLGLLTIFLIAYLKHIDAIPAGGWRKTGLVTLVAGIVLQEVLLLVQGVMAINYSGIPYINESLLISALVMFSGISLLNMGMRRTTP
jgi:hypothetical protein